MIRDEINEALNDEREVETKTPSSSIMNRNSKIRKSISQMSTAQGKKVNDPLYKRMIHYRELYIKYRALLHRKYGHSVDARARR
jgi:hypothetical protein